MKRMPAACTPSGSPKRSSRPSRVAGPEPGSGVWKPERTLIRVDLPDPLCPTSAWTSPAPTSKSTPDSARCPGKVLEIEWSSSRATGLADAPELLELFFVAFGALEAAFGRDVFLRQGLLRGVLDVARDRFPGEQTADQVDHAPAVFVDPGEHVELHDFFLPQQFELRFFTV